MTTLVGKKAPDFKLESVDQKGYFNDFTLSDHVGNYKGGIVLFFYPFDFTFVCPTELIKLSEMYEEFDKRGALIVAVNTDSKYSHSAWRNTPTEKGGIGNLNYAILSDYQKEVSKSYGVLFEEKGCPFRATFLIDVDGIVRYQSINDLPLGRNIDEILRIVDAWKFYKKNGEVCPVNWKSGDKGMEASTDGLIDYFSSKKDH
jgi:peroxiredoxin (alkyl hydroperoxide reductase subunit C)